MLTTDKKLGAVEVIADDGRLINQGWNRQVVMPLNITFLKQRKRSSAHISCALDSERRKVIRRLAPSSERAGTSKGWSYYNRTPIRGFTISDVPLPHNGLYYHARLKCGLVKGKYVG